MKSAHASVLPLICPKEVPEAIHWSSCFLYSLPYLLIMNEDSAGTLSFARIGI